MNSLSSAMVVLLGLIICQEVRPSCTNEYGDEDDSFTDLYYRDTSESDKPVREDGLGSLLLKNMRFRDLDEQQNIQAKPAHPDLQAMYNYYLAHSRGLSKRGDMSVDELAHILNKLKTRNTDSQSDGMKLHNLRFGK